MRNANSGDYVKKSLGIKIITPEIMLPAIRKIWRMEMFEVHLICKRNGVGLQGLHYDKETKRFFSGHWKLNKQDVERLVGGKIYLHPTKAAGATIGGMVEEVIGPDHENRFVIVFKSEIECKGSRWHGMDHGMAWTSGVIDAQKGA